MSKIKPLSPLNFTLASSCFPTFTCTDRTLISSFDNGEKYTVYDIYEPASYAPTAGAPKNLIRVYTHLFNSVDEARKGFFTYCVEPKYLIVETREHFM